MIEVSELVKWYGPTLAVDGISFNVEPGQIVGFLGPNGAGKSTTLKMITGYLPPTSGQATIAGFNAMTHADDARARIGYLPESNPLYLEMRVEEYLDYRGRLMSMSRNDRRQRIGVVCDRCGLSHNRRRVIGDLSKGNRQRVGLAQALLHEPPILILDEPTAGLDPTQIGEFRKLISELKGKHTILLSTHILPEIERSADQVIIIAGGRIVAADSPEQLRRKVAAGGRLIVEVKTSPEQLKQYLAEHNDIEVVEAEAQGDWTRAILHPQNDTDVREALAQTLMNQQCLIREMRDESATLEQFFVQITAEQNQQSAGREVA